MNRQVLIQFRQDPRFDGLRDSLSAVCISAQKQIWLASDELSSIERLDWVDGQFVGHESFRISDFFDLPAGPEDEIDIEGLTISDGYLWIVGSHSRKMKKAKPEFPDKKNIRRLSWSETQAQANRYLIARIPLEQGRPVMTAPALKVGDDQRSAAALKLSDDGNPFVKALREDSHIGQYVAAAIPGKANGLDIEGLESISGRLLLGLRGPVLLDWAIIVSIELAVHQDGVLKLQGDNAAARYRKHFVNLEGLGVRDLCRWGDDLLILAGPTQYLDGPARVYRLRGAHDLREDVLYRPDLLFEIPCGRGNDHPEGIALADYLDGELSLLVIYDAPQGSRLRSPNSVFMDRFSLVSAQTNQLESRQLSDGGMNSMANRNYIISHRAIANALEPDLSEEGLEAIGAGNSIQKIRDAVRNAVLVAGGSESESSELLAQLGDSLDVLAKGEKDPAVLTSVEHAMASALQSHLAEKAEQAQKAEEQGLEAKFDTNDMLGWTGSFFTWWRGIVKHKWIEPDPSWQAIDNTVRVGIVGDWGTGLYGAPR